MLTFVSFTLCLTGLTAFAALGPPTQRTPPARTGAQYVYTKIDPFGSTDVGVAGVSAGGRIAGDYVDGSGQFRGFLTGPNGVAPRTFMPPGATFLNVVGVNDRGQVLGSDSMPGDRSGQGHGFLTGPDGQGLTRIAAYGIISAGSLYVQESAYLNNLGEVAGTAQGARENTYGFVTGPNGRGLTRIVPSGATEVMVSGVNATGQVAGDLGEGSHTVGFLTGPNGGPPLIRITPAGATHVSVGGVNDRGQVAGTYVDGGGRERVFLTSPGGRGLTVIAPFGPGDVRVCAVNASGQVAGEYTASASPHRSLGFVTGRDGSRVTRLDPYEAGAVTITGLNDRGQIVGEYAASSDAADRYGFLASPLP